MHTEPDPPRTARRLALALLALALLAPSIAAAAEEADWNDAAIAWRPFEDGLAEAKQAGKPVCLVFYTTWCPHCNNYARIFADPRVVEQSANFVMVRVDRDANQPLSARYAPDGEYIPRTYFMSPDGELEPAIHAPRDKYKYFYNERDPSSLLGGMAAALEQLAVSKVEP